MIVGVCGLGNTGSFAVVDLLREYDEIYYNKDLYEFSLCYCPDGLLDLEYHLFQCPSRFQGSDMAFHRFENLTDNFFYYWEKERKKKVKKLTKEYIDSITQVSWNGTWGFRCSNYGTIKLFIYKVFFKLRPIIGEKPFIWYVNERMRYSVKPENFYEASKKYISDVIESTDWPMDKIMVIDQAFSGDNPEQCFKFYNDPYAIVVDRDPRDLYILSKCEINSDSRWIPTDSVTDFITYYKNMRERRDVLKNPTRVLYVQYEKLIYEYEETKKEIEAFLHIKMHNKKNQYLKVMESINNTQLFNKHPELLSDVKVIEKELSEWLFDYSKYPVRTVFGKVW